ncbi:MAG: ABC transporter permease [Verrucomicrobiota bacterium]|nr:ABC transporter permease [Verrucomicrobiota bacterium]
MNDLRFAFRQLRKSPGFTFVAVLTLALGIGANAAIFSVINAVLLRPIPYPDASRIMTLQESAGAQGMFALSFPDYQDLRRDNTVFEHLAISRADGDSLSGIPGRAAEHIGVANVTANFFHVIGVPPEIGRTFTEEEDRAGGPTLVVISDRLWQRVFGRDPAVVGRAIRLHDRPFTIIGVMPPAVTSPQATDAWITMMPRANNGAWQSRAIHPLLFGWGRLKPGVTVERARSEIRAIAARLEKDFPDVNKGITVVVTPILDSLVGDYRKNLTLLLGAVGFVLLIACANLANLFAARGAARAREFAIRAAVGASRARIIRQLLIESALIAIAGGLLGFLFALWSRDTLIALGPQGLDRFHDIAFDGRVLGFTFVIASVTTILFGLWPAWSTSRADVQLALHAGTRTSESRAAGKTRDWLVVAEIALTLVLLSSAGVVLKSFARAQAVSLGYQPRGLLTARIDLPFTTYRDQQKVRNFSTALIEKVRALPGVENVALSSSPPLAMPWLIDFMREGVDAKPADRPNADTEIVAGDYFSTLQATLLRGRIFNERDTKSSPLVTIIDQSLAEQYFPGEDPIGKRLSMHPDDAGDESRLYEIVGVVARMKFRGFGDASAPPVVFFPQAQVERTSFSLLVRAAKISRLEKTIRELVTSIDPAQPVYDVRPMIERVQETWATQRLLTFLLATFAALALALATIGLYGVISYSALRRLREIGVRLALGAQRTDIRTLILGRGLRLFILGAAVGIAGAACSSRFLSSVLFEVKAIDLTIYLGVTVLLAVASLVACWIPARRASRVDPIVTLRAE